MSEQIFWYLSRSSGLVSWLAAAGAILTGTMIPSRMLGRRPTIPWLTDLHRMLGAMASIFLLIHLGTLWFDHFVRFRWADLLIPFAADVPGVSRFGLALGVIAAWLTAAVELTSLARDRLPTHWWHSIHLTSYLILAIGAVHAVMTGSDIANPIVASLGTSAVTAVLLATIVRIRRRPQPEAAATTTAERRGTRSSTDIGGSADQAIPGPAPISPRPVETRPGGVPPWPGPAPRD